MAIDNINLQDQPEAVAALAKAGDLDIAGNFGRGITDFVTSDFGQALIAGGSFLPGPLGEFFRKIAAPIALSINQRAAQAKTDKEREEIFAQAEGEVTSNRVNIQNMIASLSGEVQGKFTADKNRLVSLLQGLGETEKGDINRQFTEFSTDAASSLRERGLGSTSVVAGVQGGIEERRTRSLAGLKERIRSARLGIESSFAQDSSSALQRLGLAGINFQDKNTADLINLLASKNILGPNQNTFLGLAQGSGGAFVDKASLPGTDFAAIGIELASAYFTGGASLALTQGQSVTG